MAHPMTVPPSGIVTSGPGRPRGHARPVLDWALRTRFMPERPNGPTADTLAQPERRLMIAVLDDAIGSFLKVLQGDERRARHLGELERWFADEDRAWPFSFVRICEALGLEPDTVRTALARWCVAQGDFFARRTAARLSGPRLHSARGR